MVRNTSQILSQKVKIKNKEGLLPALFLGTGHLFLDLPKKAKKHFTIICSRKVNIRKGGMPALFLGPGHLFGLMGVSQK